MVTRSAPVLVAVDRTQEAPGMVLRAAQEARHTGSRLVILHACIDAAGLPAARHWLRDLAAPVLGCDVETRSVPAAPAEAILGCALDARLVVLGHDRCRRARHRIVVGVIAAAQVPVLVYRAAPDPAAPVLVAIAGAADPEPTVAAGFETADQRGVPVVVLAVGPHDAEPAELVQRWLEKFPGVPVTMSHRHGLDAAIVVAAASRAAGLVVVAAEPRWTGSVAQAIADRARCPVLVVPSS